MSNLTDFFPAATGGGDSAIVTDPSKLPAVSTWSNTLQTKYDNNPYASSTSQFWETIEHSGARAVMVSNNAYRTVVDLTGSGYFYYGVSPCGSGNSIVTARFTVDGVVTEIPMTLNKYSATSNGRALFGAYTAGTSNSASSTIVGWNQAGGDYGYEINRTNFSPLASENYQVKGIGLLRADFFNFPGAPKLRFETDFKLEFKIPVVNSASYGNFTGAVYKLD